MTTFKTSTPFVAHPQADAGGIKRIIVEDSKGRDFLDYREGSGDSVEIFDIEVGSDRRKGKGRELVWELFRQIPKTTILVWAMTRSSNTVACTFYSSLGFRVLGVLSRFYEGDGSGAGEDAIVYGKYTAEIGASVPGLNWEGEP